MPGVLDRTRLTWRGLLHWATTPAGPFDARRAPRPPDYANPSSWAALPGKASRAAAVPPKSDAVDARAGVAADAFFVHPTTYFWRAHWNAPIDGWLTRKITAATLAGQASAFNGAARIYAPYYRQMTLSGFRDAGVCDFALALAYEDVRRAFLHYLEAWSDGRPLILVGHSQGSRHVLRILDEFFRDGPLRRRLVAAFAVGARVSGGAHERGEAAIPICESREQTGCLISWSTFAEGADPSLHGAAGEPSGREPVCVNPLSWRRDEIRAPASANLGSIAVPGLGGPGAPYPGLTGARCADGLLWIDPISHRRFRRFHPDGDWHAYDYALFYMNVRENVKRRVDAFLGERR